MVRDQILTEIAYHRGYNVHPCMKENHEMWKDADLALYQKEKYLNSINDKSRNELNILTEYINTLQQKYSDRIEINLTAFNNITLTRINMLALQQNVPYPVYVPAFPQITNDNKLDYGKAINR